MGGEDAIEEVEVAPEEVEAIVCEDAIGSACGVGGTAGAVVVGVGSKSERSVVVMGRIGIAIPAAPKRGAGVANPGRKTDAEESVLEGAGRRCGTSVTAVRELEEEVEKRGLSSPCHETRLSAAAVAAAATAADFDVVDMTP